VQNAYFPQLIPYSFITKEASHVEGESLFLIPFACAISLLTLCFLTQSQGSPRSSPW
jgi:hypothetical protein